jgi:hypothetical protein
MMGVLVLAPLAGVMSAVSLVASLLFPAPQASPTFALDARFLTPPEGMATIGDAHGDIAVAPTGDIYVSVQGGDRAGVQVYSAKGKYLRNVPNAPTDLHGFIIAKAPDGAPAIFGVSQRTQHIVELGLDGAVKLDIPVSVIPDPFKNTTPGKPATILSGIAVAPNGDIYAVDGYGTDFIHRFDKTGRYLASFGGKGAPWNFDQCHKIAIDPRFKPARLLCADRHHSRIVAMDLDGHVLGVFAEPLRYPSAMAIYKNELAVAELDGRVSILDLKGRIVASVGANENKDQIRGNTKAPPEIWEADKFYSPHGLAYDKDGNLVVTEWSKWGRVTRIARQ